MEFYGGGVVMVLDHLICKVKLGVIMKLNIDLLYSKKN